MTLGNGTTEQGPISLIKGKAAQPEHLSPLSEDLSFQHYSLSSESLCTSASFEALAGQNSSLPATAMPVTLPSRRSTEFYPKDRPFSAKAFYKQGVVRLDWDPGKRSHIETMIEYLIIEEPEKSAARSLPQKYIYMLRNCLQELEDLMNLGLMIDATERRRAGCFAEMSMDYARRFSDEEREKIHRHALLVLTFLNNFKTDSKIMIMPISTLSKHDPKWGGLKLHLAKKRSNDN